MVHVQGEGRPFAAKAVVVTRFLIGQRWHRGILLVRETDKSYRKPLWALPGGTGERLTLANGGRLETVMEALVRELHEETGVNLGAYPDDRWEELVEPKDKGDHLLHFKGTFVFDLWSAGLQPYGPVTGEETWVVSFIKLRQLIAEGEVVPTHARVLQRNHTRHWMHKMTRPGKRSGHKRYLRR